ncbi:MAG TPA: hypothetical protein VFE24_02380 [Pirellulales bacterium]|jgi:hypothetical protein|nr:hypothetical protein [Pirellulales bacterium]
MPFRINGVGTSYFGKTNIKEHQGICNSCGRQVMLRDYETRLCFSVLFVPLIPLARKQIFNYCPRCTRHYAVPVADWNIAKDNAIQASTAQVASDPTSAAASLELFSTLVACQQPEQAAELAQAMLKEFPDSADVLLRIASWYRYRSTDRRAEARPLQEKALQLEPGNLAAKRVVALDHIQNGDPNRAKQVLQSFPAMTPLAEPQLFFQLAKAFQGTNQHAETLEILRALQTTPIVRDPFFKKIAQQSERTLGVEESLLPKTPWYRRKPAMIGAAMAAAAVALLAVNAYLASHCSLFVVNGFAEALEVQLDGVNHAVPRNSSVKLAVSEGPHQAVTTHHGQIISDDHFTIARSPLERVFKGPTFVLNAGHGAVLKHQKATYAVAGNAPPTTTNYLMGTTFIQFRDVDYAMETLPPQLDLPNGKPITVTRIDFAREGPLASLAESEASPDQMIGYLEKHLQVTPETPQLAQIYASLAVAEPQQKLHCLSFLESGLERRPVELEWHRAYQFLAGCQRKRADLIDQYQKFLDQDSKNPNLLYLFGRIQSSRQQAIKYFDEAIALNASHAHALRARSWRNRVAGDFAAARRDAEAARQAAPSDPTMLEDWREEGFLLQDYASVEQAVREELLASPFSLELNDELLEALVDQNRRPAALESIEQYRRHLQAKEIPLDVANHLVQSLNYDSGDFKRLAEDPCDPNDESRIRFEAAFELGDLSRAAELLKNLAKSGPAPDEELCFAIAWRSQQDLAKAKEWEQRAIEHFRERGIDESDIGDFLEHPERATIESARDLPVDVREKAIVLTAVAQQCVPEQRQKILALARQLNGRLQFPHHFLTRMQRKLDGAPPSAK